MANRAEGMEITETSRMKRLAASQHVRLVVEAFRTWRGNFFAILGLAAIGQLPDTLKQLFVIAENETLWWVGYSFTFTAIALRLWTCAAIIRLVVERRRGREISFGAALFGVEGNYWRFIGLLLFSQLTIAAGLFVGAIPGFILATTLGSKSSLTAFGFGGAFGYLSMTDQGFIIASLIIGTIPGFILMALLAPMPAIALAEPDRRRGFIARSRALTHKQRLVILSLAALTPLLLYGSIISTRLLVSEAAPLWIGVTLLHGLLIWPIWATSCAVIYHHLTQKRGDEVEECHEAPDGGGVLRTISSAALIFILFILASALAILSVKLWVVVS
jgi:hypothetical protein